MLYSQVFFLGLNLLAMIFSTTNSSFCVETIFVVRMAVFEFDKSLLEAD